MNESSRTHIVIGGWYGKSNAGDDAILDVFVIEAARRYACDFTVLSEEPDKVEQGPRVRALFHQIVFGRGMLAALLTGKTWRYIAHMRKGDIFVLGGGGLLRDNTTWRNLVRLLDELWFARLLGRRTMLYAIGVGPFKSRLGKWLIGATVRGVDVVTVRSENCATLLRDIGVPHDRIEVVADPAFLLESAAPSDVELKTLFEGGNKIGFYPTFALLLWWQGDAHLRRFAAALDTLVETEGAEFVALPMSVLENGFDDVKTAKTIRSFMRYPEAMHVYDKRLTANELKWATGRARMNITVRLHAMIFSLGSDVPVVAVNYEPKVGNVFAEFDAPECLVTIDDHLDANLARASRHCLNNLDWYSERIARRREVTTASAKKMFDLLGKLCRVDATVPILRARKSAQKLSGPAPKIDATPAPRSGTDD